MNRTLTKFKTRHAIICKHRNALNFSIFSSLIWSRSLRDLILIFVKFCVAKLLCMVLFQLYFQDVKGVMLTGKEPFVIELLLRVSTGLSDTDGWPIQKPIILNKT